MSNIYSRLTDAQVKIIIDGVRDDVDYDVIAERAGLSHKKRVSDFLIYRMVQEYTKSKDDKIKGIIE